VRLALAWKGLAAEIVPVDLRQGLQSESSYKTLNPQGLVPLLVTGEHALMQSLAIIEYLDETHPSPPLLPADSLGRAHVRAAAQIIASDIHPINNLRVLRYLKDPLGHDQGTIDIWARHWITAGLTALEAFAARFGGRFLYADTLTLADLCLVPQLYNARRVATDLACFPRILAAEAAILGENRLAPAHPEVQPDAF
jgi:maleylacetoacetate isomerase